MKALLPLALVAALVGILSGCAEFQLDSHYDQRASFSSLKTYAWSPTTAGSASLYALDRDYLDAKTRVAIDANLADKGYRLDSSSSPDFLITYRSATKHKVETSDLDGQQGYGAGLGRADDYGASVGSGSGTLVEEYEEGTLLITVSSPDGRRALWTGSARGAVLEDASRKKRGERLERAVEQILRRFPP